MIELPPSYCSFVLQNPAPENELHRIYHDTQYGFPLATDNELFGRLILEIFQAGLNWGLILKKQNNFEKAFQGYDINKVAAFNQADFDMLMQDVGIVRNRLKINAAINNAQVILGLQHTHGSFKNWLDTLDARTLPEYTKIFKKTFRFTGGEIVNEFLMSSGYLKGAHVEGCPVYKKILKQQPVWHKRK